LHRHAGDVGTIDDSRIRLVLPDKVGPRRIVNVPLASVSETSDMWFAPPTCLLTLRNSSVTAPSSRCR
jgi:hypothetical protein